MKSLRPRAPKAAVLQGFCPVAAEAPKVKIGARVTLTLTAE
jgi:hypothetical protein